ncbi:MAG: protein kinase [Candidatus Obscuribacterales bacterium]|nr:protein kinase [Candidatus Obscuribacterales bacterium]
MVEKERRVAAQEELEQSKKACVLCGGEFPGNLELCPEDGTLLTPISKEPKAGDIFAERYEILGTLGDGGMGKVYKARHNLMKRIVAIKMLLPHLVSSAAALKRFQQEAQAASALNHPNIPTVYDFGISDKGIPFLVMDYLEGKSLATILQESGSLSQERTVPIFIQACSALAHAHSKGVIHRDLKPANIMLIEYEGHTDVLKIVDFGIAKLLQPDGAEQLTHTGEVFGSPLYMSPEQCRGKELDQRSDIYSLGCVLYRAVTGRPVFGGRDAMECMYKQVNDLPGSFSDICPELGLSEKLESAVFKAIAKQPEDRFQNMTEFREALEIVRGGTPSSANKLFSVPPDSGQVVAYDAVTDQLKRPGMNATQYAGPPASEKEGSKGEASAGQEQVQDSAEGAKAPMGTAPALESNTGVSLALGAVVSSPNKDNYAMPAPNAGRELAPAEKGGAKADSSVAATDGGGKLKLLVGGGLAAVILVALAASMMHGPKPDAVDPAALPLHAGPTKGSGSAAALSSKAQSQLSTEDYKGAEETLNKALGAAASDDELLKVLPMQANVYMQADKFDQAKDTYSKLLATQQRLGASSYDIARTKAQMAVALLQLGQVDDASLALADAESVLANAPADQKHGLSDVYYGLAKINLQDKKLDKALTYLEQAADCMSKDDPDLVQVWQDRGEIYMLEQRKKEALTALDKALRISNAKFGPDSVESADIYKLQATVYTMNGSPAAAEGLFKKSLSIKSSHFGADSLSAAEVMTTLAMLYTGEGKYKLAEPLFKDALAIRTKELGANSPQALRTKEFYAKMQAAMRGAKK